MRKTVFPALAVLLLASCATVPTPLQGQFDPVTPAAAVQSGATGQEVRWGGEIIDVHPGKEKTCFEILDRKLGPDARPLRRADGDGRFMACHEGFYDPEIFRRGRDATVTGRVTGTDHGSIGDYDYVYPHVAATTIHLWPPRPDYPPGAWYGPGFHDPFWGPCPGGFWPYGGFGAPVIVVPRPHPHPRPPPRDGH
jgi:outer membrane lipoprotein